MVNTPSNDPIGYGPIASGEALAVEERIRVIVASHQMLRDLLLDWHRRGKECSEDRIRAVGEVYYEQFQLLKTRIREIQTDVRRLGLSGPLIGQLTEAFDEARIQTAFSPEQLQEAFTEMTAGKTHTIEEVRRELRNRSR